VRAEAGVDEEQLPHSHRARGGAIAPRGQPLDQKDLLEQGQVALDAASGNARVRREAFDLEQLGGEPSGDAQQVVQRLAPRHVGQLRDIAFHEVVRIGLEELRPARLVASGRFREATSREPLDQLLASEGAVGKAGLIVEDPVDEAIDAPLQLTLGKRPELDGLHATHQRIGQRLEAEHPRRPCEQEPTGPLITIHRRLDGQHQLGRSLNLVDGQQVVVLNEAGRIGARRRQGDAVVQRAPPRSFVRLEHLLDQGALACLPGPVHQHHPGVSKRGNHGLLGMAKQLGSHTRNLQECRICHQRRAGFATPRVPDLPSNSCRICHPVRAGFATSCASLRVSATLSLE
jgi:hypothetical protein